MSNVHSVKWFSGLEPFRIMAQSTLQNGQISKVSFARMAAAEHSPIRAVEFIVEMTDIPTFVSVHLSRHKYGIEHAVQSNRTDRRILELHAAEEPNRLTPIRHTFKANAQALIHISRKRLCGQASMETQVEWHKVIKALRQFASKQEPDLRESLNTYLDLLVPECVYRNGMCPELQECKMGVKRIVPRYTPWPGNRIEV